MKWLIFSALISSSYSFLCYVLLGLLSRLALLKVQYKWFSIKMIHWVMPKQVNVRLYFPRSQYHGRRTWGSLRMLKGYGGGKRLKTPEFDLSFIISGSSDTVVWREFLLPRDTEDALLAVTVRRKLRLLCTALSNTFAVS